MSKHHKMTYKRNTCMKDFATRQSLWKHKQSCKLFPKALNFLELDDAHRDNYGQQSVNRLGKGSEKSNYTESENGSEVDESESENESEEEEMEEDASNQGEHNINVWKVIADEADVNDKEDVLTSFKNNVLFAQSLLHDITFLQVMRTVKKAKVEYQMGFKEALEYATDRRKFLILNAIKDARKEEESDREEEHGSGMFLSPHHRR